MGTRSLTRIIPRQDGLSFAEGHEKGELAWVNMYRHNGGDPRGHGLDLAEFLKDFKIINGIGYSAKLGIHANGEGCLAAQMVAHFKDSVGDIYLYPIDNEGAGDEDYIYTIYPKGGEPCFISIYDVRNKKCIFVGTALKLIEKYKLNTD
tara:strand:+ start:157 stop:603 length:447 start_codon:yes stop_codon:yes gene_type:complete